MKNKHIYDETIFFPDGACTYFSLCQLATDVEDTHAWDVFILFQEDFQRADYYIMYGHRRFATTLDGVTASDAIREAIES